MVRHLVYTEARETGFTAGGLSVPVPPLATVCVSTPFAVCDLTPAPTWGSAAQFSAVQISWEFPVIALRYLGDVRRALAITSASRVTASS